MNRVLTFGVYDYFHLGHLRLFKQCKEYGDYLIVAVQDGDYIKKYKPGVNILYSTEERVEIIEALKVVDRVVVYQTVCTDFLETIDFEVLALGEDHVGERFDKIVEWCDTNEKKRCQIKTNERYKFNNCKGQSKIIKIKENSHDRRMKVDGTYNKTNLEIIFNLRLYI